MEEEKVDNNYPDDIKVECDGWRSWKKLGEELLDWEGVVDRRGWASDDLDDDRDSHFCINMKVYPSKAKEILGRLKSYSGVVRGEWTGSFSIMDSFGHWRGGH